MSARIAARINDVSLFSSLRLPMDDGTLVLLKFNGTRMALTVSKPSYFSPEVVELDKKLKDALEASVKPNSHYVFLCIQLNESEFTVLKSLVLPAVFFRSH